MNVQIDELTLVIAVVSASVTTVGLILGGGWMLLSNFRKDMAERLAQSDHGLQERQDAFMRLMSQHIASEDRQFAAIAQAQAEMQRKIDSFQRDYVTRTYLEEKLMSIKSDTSQTKRIVDSRQQAGIDPVSGRPPEIERRRQGQPDGD